MTSDARMPTARTVARSQLQLLVQTMYLPSVITLPLLSLMAIHEFGGRNAGEIAPWFRAPLLMGILPALIGIAVIAAIIAWINEGPRKRRYHWSMPVQREVHDAMRITAGAIWLVVAIAICLAVGVATEEKVVRDQWAMHTPWLYVNFIVVPLLAYLLTSIATVLWDRAILWLGIMVIALITCASPFVEQHAPFVADVYRAVIDGAHGEPYTLGNALTGYWNSSLGLAGAERERVFVATVDKYVANAKPGQASAPAYAPLPDSSESLDHFKQRQLASIRRATGYYHVSRTYRRALLLWYALALAGLFLAVKRRPDV